MAAASSSFSSAEPLVCERFHPRHDPRWLLEGLPSPLCLACALETLKEDGVSQVRKKHVLFCLQEVLSRNTPLVIPLFAQDERVCAYFITTLFEILQTMEDSSALDLPIEILVVLIMELKLDRYLHYLLDECRKELYKVTTVRGSLPIFILLGKLADAIPSFAEVLVIEHSNIMEHLASGLKYPSENIKTAVCYLYGKLYSVPSVAERLSVHFTERLCDLFLTTMKNAQTKELQLNCIGLLQQLLKYGYFVSVIMSNSGKGADSASPELFEGDRPLPLMLKKLLLSRDEILQVASAQCISAVLVHSPGKYAPAFIHADIPEFLFECLFCMSEILIWSIYCCLLLLTEEQLFFSKCHTVYGIEPILRSLKEILLLNNTELQKQGLLLFTEILKRQPVEIKLFTNNALFRDAINILLAAVNSPVLEVAGEAMKAATAILRKDHVNFPPIEYGELQKLVEGVLKRCNDLSLAPFNRRLMSHLGGRHQNKAISQQGQFLQSALESFRNACRLAVECQNDPLAQENAFTAPNSEKKDTLKSFSEFLLRMSDSLCIPIVMKYSERAVRPYLMEVFISTLNILFIIMPHICKIFSIKLATSSFIRLNLELKAKFCTGQSNPALNQACSSFLHSMCLSLHSSSEKMVDSSQKDQEISELLQKSLPELNFGVLESLSFLSETPDSFCLDETLRSHQYSLLLLFYFAFSQEDRFVPETQLFSAIRSFLLSVQDQGDCPPPYVFKAVLYLLACCQDKTEALDLVSLATIRRILDAISDLSLVYVHHPLMLKFFLHYPELMKRFGHCILQLWFSCEDYSQIESEDAVTSDSAVFLQSFHSLNSLLSMLKGNLSALLVLLDLVCFGTGEVVHKVLITLKIFLKLNEDIHVCDLLRSQFLQILQKLLIENNSSTLPVNQTLPLSLNLLFLVQLRYVMERELDNTDFRLLHLVSNLSGKCNPSDHEILQPSLNFLYWSLQQTTLSSRQRVVAMLFSNAPLLELLEKVLHCTWMPASSSEPAFSASSEALLCSAWLLTASLLSQQNAYNTEVHHVICLDVDKFFSALAFRKEKPLLFFVSVLQFLRAFFRQTLCSSFVKFVQQGKELPQSKEDVSLYPLALDHVLSLVIHLQNLLVQRDLLLSQSAIGCLEGFLAYLQPKNQTCHIASQPWNKFLLITLLDGGENSLLQPEILRLVTLFMQYQRTSIVSHTEISHILKKAANTKLRDLSDATVNALRSFLLQIQSGKCQMDSSQTVSVEILLESLPSTNHSHSTHQDMVCLGGVAVCLSQIRN
ncbi:meiosis inhibitor protein 1 isoform X2 [Sceloporus undulatus]|uniref:meiosis inhibitor protein 1 isoform X2 n=1 Tax=Sceloporus undulatus TaxID=8520 RepID=UPI001C4B6986|nr:meiosis inhibitor protein 1 isoform X2 [Sceloporus undulatus]